MTIAAIAATTKTAIIAASNSLSDASSSALLFSQRVSALKAEMDTLVNRQQFIEFLLIVSTVVLLFGLFLEFRSEVREWLVKAKFERTGLEPSELIETARDKLWTVIGAVLVIVGIAAEIWLTNLSIKNDLKFARDDSRLAELFRSKAVASDTDIANVSNDTRRRTERRYIHCDKKTFANLRIPEKTEIVLASGVGDGPDFLFTFVRCFWTIGWPPPKEIKLQPGDRVSEYAVRDFGVAIVHAGGNDPRDIPNWWPDPSDPKHEKPVPGTPQRALYDTLTKSVEDVIDVESARVPPGTIQVVIGPKP